MPKRYFEYEDREEGTSSAEKRRKMEYEAGQAPAARTTKLKLAHEYYTVGWVCAMSTEYVAAQAFLDEKHEGPEYVSPNDNNDYTLGKVGKHNVVIATLPEGEYGISSAASVARDMLHSFPNVRIGLMVGIGGGAPSQRHDIRLGDIVVSAPRDGIGGVFQYDFGKTIQDQSFRPTGFLNQPPMVLRTAVNGLKVQYKIEGHRLEEIIFSTLEKKPRLRQEYKRPDQSTDRLYQAGVTHPKNDEVSCAVVCGDDPSRLILRAERTKDEDNPAIHYSLIASANQLIEDALVRDKLAVEKDVLCFETEAAGLMNHFPCLIIRGVCDYSDTHKNKEWQGYAAMSAAAYAKDLLYRIPPNKVEAEKRISDLFTRVLDIVCGTGANVETMMSKLGRNEDLEILKWLTPADYGPQQSDYIRRREPGTGQWLLESTKYQTWLEADKQTLFCPGIPGAGKTILTSIVIDNLGIRFQDKPNIGIAYLYCNFRRRDEQKVEDLLASLLKQLSQKRTSLPDSIKALVKRHKEERTRPLLDEISKALHSLTTMYSRVFIVVDALDECQVSDGCQARFLSEIFNLQAKCGANIFATSRFIPEITEKFKGSMSLKIRASEGDVRRYLDGHMFKLPGFVVRNSELQEDIKTEIGRSVDGMFLLVQLHLDSLIGKRAPRAIRTALKTLPTGSEAYDQAYDDAMERIERQAKEPKELAKQVMSWIICAKRPLTTSELQHALAVEHGDIELCDDNFVEVEDMVSVCAGLVTVDEESKIIRLVHHTTLDYFERMQQRWFPNAEEDITIVCLTYLSFDTFQSGYCVTDREFEERLYSSRLYEYASCNWGHHARRALTSSQMVTDFLKSIPKTEASSQALLAKKHALRQSNWSQEFPRRMRGLHLAAYFGLEGAVSVLLRHRPGAKDTYGRTPLSWAAASGYETIVKLLIEARRDCADAKDSKMGQTPLSFAAENGHVAVVKLLLHTGIVNVDSRDIYDQTPLMKAAQRGHEAMVKLLLEYGADLQSKDNNFGWTPLFWAVWSGNAAIVKLLLADDSVDADSMDAKHGRMPLSWAADKGYEQVVKLLLEKVEDVDPKDFGCGRTPLSRAAGNGYEGVVKLLLGEAVNLDSRDAVYGRTPLLWAARNGHEAIMGMLLKEDVDVDAGDNFGQMSLSYMAWSGSEAAVKLLLENAVSVDSKDTYYGRTALSYAAEAGHEAVLKLLLEKAVNVDSKSNTARTSLSYAAEDGHEAVVKLLLENPVDMDSKSNTGRTPLSYAAENGHEAVVKLLLENSVDMETKSNTGRTPLSYATENGHQALVTLLSSKNKVSMELPSVNNNGMNALPFLRKGMRAWQLEAAPCQHIRQLKQAARKLDIQSLGLCSKCDLKGNLWLCLKCANLGCGRVQYGSEGNGHALAHYNKSLHPVAVNIGTVTPEITADVYCYVCGENRSDPQLAAHLAHWEINIAECEKTEKSLSEIQIELQYMWLNTFSLPSLP